MSAYNPIHSREGHLQWKEAKVLVTAFFSFYRWELLKFPDSHSWIVSWKTDKFDPQRLKKTSLTFFSKSAWPQYPLECGKWPVEGAFNYNSILQLDRFCRRKGKWVEVPYVLLFFFLRDMPVLCPKSTDFGAKLSAPSCPLTLPLPLYLGLTTEQT